MISEIDRAQSNALGDLIPFVQFKKREKHLWRSVTLVKLQVLVFSCVFLNCTNGTKSLSASQIIIR